MGSFLWIAIIYRGIRARLKNESRGNMPWLFFYSGLMIPAFYAVGQLAGAETHLTVAELWRFWVVHLWVEDFLELFTTVMVAYIFVMLGVVRQRIALGVIFLDVILYSAGGVIGTMHHLYFSGTPVEHMALGAFFSALYTELEPVGAAEQAPGRSRFGSDSRPDETDLRAGEQSRWRSQPRGPGTSGDGPGVPVDGPGTARRARRWRRRR